MKAAIGCRNICFVWLFWLVFPTEITVILPRHSGLYRINLSYLLKHLSLNLSFFGQEGKPGIARLIFPSSISSRRFFIHCLRFWLLVSQNCCGNFSSTPLITAIANSKQHKSTSYKTIENFKTHAPFAYHVNDLKMCRLYFVQKDRWYSNKIQDSGCTSYSCVFRRWSSSSLF